MYEISVESHFDAAHFLRGYQGKCEALHGHRYKVVVTVKTSRLNDIGLAFDFTELKKHLADTLADYDHTCLNDLPSFAENNPSAENIASTIYEKLKPRLAAIPVTLASVGVWESPDSWVTYTPD